ncbi:MAG TPA: DUF2946 family protein [Methylocystis sp.]|nr:DUF2946 family protein [Methylocystis sp.]
MQRNGIVGLLFVLALAIQAMLPGASAFAHSEEGSASAGYELCWKTASWAVQKQDEGSGQSERRHDGCLFCQASSSGAAPVVASATTTAFVSTSYQLRRFAADAALPRSYDESVRQARAPPQLF